MRRSDVFANSFEQIRGHLLLHRAFELLEFLSLAPDSNHVVFKFKRLDKDGLRAETGGSVKGMTSLTLTDAHEQSARQTLATVAGNRKARFIVETGGALRGLAKAVLAPTRKTRGKYLQNFERRGRNFINDMASPESIAGTSDSQLSENRSAARLRKDGAWRNYLRLQMILVESPLSKSQAAYGERCIDARPR